MLPLILHYLEVGDVGLWFVFLTVGAIIQMLEAAFQPVITRNASYIFSGAQKLDQEIRPLAKAHLAKINVHLLNELIAETVYIYKWMFWILGPLIIVIGGAYIVKLNFKSLKIYEAITAWMLFSIGILIGMRYNYQSGILFGKGNTRDVNHMVIISKSTQILCSAILLSLGFGIIGLSSGYLLSIVLARRFLNHKFDNALKKNQVGNQGEFIQSTNVKKIIVNDAIRIFLVQLGAFLVQRGSVFLVSNSFGLGITAKYSLSVNLISSLISVSMVGINLKVPRINAMQIRGETNQLPAMVGRSLIESISIYTLGLLILIIFSDRVLLYIGSRTTMVEGNMLLLMGLIGLFEMVHSSCALLITTFNKTPFVIASLMSGFMTIIVAVLLQEKFGVYGVVFSQAFVQLIYNNWKWPCELAKLLNTSLTKMFLEGYKAIVGINKPT